ncbi:hypothetical protein EUTSA_v10009233mg [Eutrema salsugineum]|uniref:Myb-like domain-containing protein n=1 Tax=Eutrema salsugineum TaxID=72664 RepID=V4MWM4_EUTSA|nr:MYB-like transcription factor ETC1 [Eutrema salsugineum]ESQ36771.1 hypothetical protein EUTSA_v10009233mg [Eutrema salsugineum]
MDKQRKSKHPKTSATIVASTSEEVSSLEWEEVAMTQEEEDLICRMYKLIGERWELIAGRIPGRTAYEIERFWVMKNHGRSQLR